jgi:hypothetical protein
MVYRGSIARRLIWLSTLRRGSYPPTTQDSLPAAGPALPDGIGYPQGSLRKVSSLQLSSFPGLTWRKVGPGFRFSPVGRLRELSKTLRSL